MVDTYKVDTFAADTKNFQLHKMFADLQAAEAACLASVRASEHEVRALKQFHFPSRRRRRRFLSGSGWRMDGCS